MSIIYQVFQGPTWRGDASTLRRAQQIVDECVARGCHPNFLRIETKEDGFGNRADPYEYGGDEDS